MSGTTITAADLQVAAEDLATLDTKIEDAKRELDALREARAERERLILTYADVGAAFDAGPFWVRVKRGRSARSTDEQRCDELREVLLDCGLGERVVTYRPPTVASIEAAAAALLERGVNPADLIRLPHEPPLKLERVLKERT